MSIRSHLNLCCVLFYYYFSVALFAFLTKPEKNMIVKRKIFLTILQTIIITF